MIDTDTQTATAPASADRHSNRARGAADRARDVASEALDRTRKSARDAAGKVADGVESAPISVLVGGLALGALAGALIPVFEREGELIGPVGRKLNAAAGTAVDAAKDAGKAELLGLGLSKDAARSQATTLVQGLLQAVATAGAAAMTSRKSA